MAMKRVVKSRVGIIGGEVFVAEEEDNKLYFDPFKLIEVRCLNGCFESLRLKKGLRLHDITCPRCGIIKNGSPNKRIPNFNMKELGELEL
jgi:hypothetical protein